MPLQRINHRQLEAFRAAVQLGSATAAAERLRVSQPAVSRLLSDLEHAVGFVLFERHRKGLRPTADALLFFEEVERSYRGLDRIQSIVDAIRAKQTGRVRIAVMPVYADGFVARLVGEFLRTHPGISVELESLTKVGVVEGVATQLYDLGVATLPIQHPAIVSEAFSEGTAVCMLPVGHELASKRAVHWRDLHDEPFIALGPGSPYRLSIQKMLEEHGVQPRTVAEVRTQRAINQMVAAGAGVAVVDSNVATELEEDLLTKRPMQPTAGWTIALLRPARRHPSQALDALMAYLRNRSRN